MKRALMIGACFCAIIVSANEFSLDISDAGADVNLQVTGSPGVHEIQSKTDLSTGDWKPEGLTTETNISRQKTARAGFFRAAAAPEHDNTILANAHSLINSGRQIFRFDTFGSEKFWGDKLRLHEAVAGANNGGAGSGVSPRMALEVGLKVDAHAVPPALAGQIQRGELDLDDPANTLALLKLNAVVGVTGFFDGAGKITSLGIQCAICHSTVDNSFLPSIGNRLDGWPNRDLNIGAIVNLSPDVSALTQALEVDENTVRTVLQSWGPGKFDAELILDGKAFRPDGKSAATLMPAAFGLAGVNLQTYTGWGSVTHWNAFVSTLEMHGQGTFWDPRLNDANTFPLAAKNGYGNLRTTNDVVTSKLAPLHFYQLSIPAPTPPASNFNAEASVRGQALFADKARCATCHVPPLFTEPGWNMHTPAEIGIDDFQANRSPDKRYRTTPLKGLFTRSKGGFYHDGRFAALQDVVNHYNSHLSLSLSDAEKADLIEYLKSL
ncbi:MAG: hypothetical protein ACR2OZ_02580 [Verrucomicrobiales bacterium]